MTESTFAAALSLLTSKEISILWHDSPRGFVRANATKGKISFSLHRAFLEAPADLLSSLLAFAEGGKEGRAAIRRFAASRAEKEVRPAGLVSTRGLFHDLASILAEVERDFPVDGLVPLSITWHAFRMNRKSVVFGQYDATRRLILINRLLDKGDVPRHVVAFIAFHERLHAIIPPQWSPQGRRLVHTPLFKEKEALFPHYHEVKRWEKEFAAKVFCGRA